MDGWDSEEETGASGAGKEGDESGKTGNWAHYNNLNNTTFAGASTQVSTMMPNSFRHNSSFMSSFMSKDININNHIKLYRNEINENWKECYKSSSNKLQQL